MLVIRGNGVQLPIHSNRPAIHALWSNWLSLMGNSR